MTASVGAALADISEGQFQAAWYYSIIVAAMFILVLIGGGYALQGAIRVWREGDHAAGGVIAAAALTGVLIMVGFLLAGSFGLHNMFQGG